MGEGGEMGVGWGRRQELSKKISENFSKYLFSSSYASHNCLENKLLDIY